MSHFTNNIYLILAVSVDYFAISAVKRLKYVIAINRINAKKNVNRAFKKLMSLTWVCVNAVNYAFN